MSKPTYENPAMMLGRNNYSPAKRSSIFSSGGEGVASTQGNRGRGSSNSLFQKKTARGKLLDGVWYCDCEQRLPANRFQTRNNGVNHGRWFYTCQKQRPEQCGFFLWDDDAKLRAERDVLENGRSERSEKSPSKNMDTPRTTGLPTPRTSQRAWPPTSGQRAMSDPFGTPTKKSGSMAQQAPSTAGLFTDDEDDDDDSFGWDEDLEEEVGKLTQQDPVPTPRLTPPETPRKVPRTDTLTSPGKRKLADMQGDSEGSHRNTKARDSGSSFPLTPGTSSGPLHPPNFSTLHTPHTDSLKTTSSVGEATPTPARFSSQDFSTPHSNTQNSSSSQQTPKSSSHCALATQVVTLLEAHKVQLNQAAKDDLRSLLDRHDLKAQGVTRGREITRIALQKKEEKVKELMGRIEALEAERELGKTAIAGLKTEKRGNW